MGRIASRARAGSGLALVGACLVLADATSAGQVLGGGGPAHLLARNEVVRPPGLIPHVAPPSRAPRDRQGGRGSAEPANRPHSGHNPPVAPAAPVFPPVTPLE